MSAMFQRPISRILTAVSILTFGIVTVVSAQTGTQSTPAPDTMAQLLAEVRSLRAEVRQAADTSLRAQLLVARLQLQEQRINSLTRQLADTQKQLGDNERGRAAMAGSMTMFGRDEDARPGDENKELDKVLGPLKAQLKLMEKADADLQAQQTYLTGLIAEEQSRWATFNAMLDELGKPVEVKPRR
jgi:hypothetical protein